MKSYSVTIQIKAIDQYFLAVLFYYAVQYSGYTVQLRDKPPQKHAVTIATVDKILKCDHSNKSYWAVIYCGSVYYAFQGGSYFLLVCG